MRRKLHEIEELLRNGKVPDADLSHLRHEAWQKLLAARRQRRRPKGFLRLPPWVWALASILLIVLSLLVMLWLR